LPASFAPRLLLGAPRLFLGARGLRFGALFGALATVGGFTPIAAATTASAAALSGLSLIARLCGLGRYGLNRCSPLLGGLRLGWALSAPKPLEQMKSFRVIPARAL
jgi:hypothetical protein